MTITVEHFAEKLKGEKVVLFTDGNEFCAVLENFENLQESPAGFGENVDEAIHELMENMENVG